MRLLPLAHSNTQLATSYGPRSLAIRLPPVVPFGIPVGVAVGVAVG
eukprot:gene4822-4979_t